MENQTILIATAGFAAAGIEGYMYLNKSDDVVNENDKIGTTNVADLKLDEPKSKSSWWSNFWGDQHKQQKVMEELKEQQASALYN